MSDIDALLRAIDRAIACDDQPLQESELREVRAELAEARKDSERLDAAETLNVIGSPGGWAAYTDKPRTAPPPLHLTLRAAIDNATKGE